MAPSLGLKILLPTAVEKQNVNLCLKLFDEKNIAAMKMHPNKCKMEGTIFFLTVISNWWKCVNWKFYFSGILKRDKFREPIRSMHDKNVLFLRSFVE